MTPGQWHTDGTWQVMYDLLRGDIRVAAGKWRQPSAGIFDDQSVKTTAKAGSAVLMSIRQKVRREIVKHPKGVEGFRLLIWRWIVEQTFGWLGHYRRLSKENEY